MPSADHRSVNVVAFGGMIKLTNHAPVAISIDLDDIDACLDHVLQGGSCLGAVWLISLWGVDAVQSDSSAIHQDNGIAVSDSIDFDVLSLVWNTRGALVGDCDMTYDSA